MVGERVEIPRQALPPEHHPPGRVAVRPASAEVRTGEEPLRPRGLAASGRSRGVEAAAGFVHPEPAEAAERGEEEPALVASAPAAEASWKCRAPRVAPFRLANEAASR